MTIAEAREKCKGALARIPRDILVVLTVLVASSASFGLGFLAGRDAAGQGTPPHVDAPTDLASAVVASKNGIKYYPADCSSAERIAEVNRIYFASPAAAEAAGYSASSACR